MYGIHYDRYDRLRAKYGLLHEGTPALWYALHHPSPRIRAGSLRRKLPYWSRPISRIDINSLKDIEMLDDIMLRKWTSK